MSAKPTHRGLIRGADNRTAAGYADVRAAEKQALAAIKTYRQAIKTYRQILELNMSRPVIKAKQIWKSTTNGSTWDVLAIRGDKWLMYNAQSNRIDPALGSDIHENMTLIRTHDGADITDPEWRYWVKGMDVPDESKLDVYEQWNGAYWSPTIWKQGARTCRYKLKEERANQNE